MFQRVSKIGMGCEFDGLCPTLFHNLYTHQLWDVDSILLREMQNYGEILCRHCMNIYVISDCSLKYQMHDFF